MKRKDSEERRLAKRQLGMPPVNPNEDASPLRKAPKSPQPNQVGEASKKDERSNVSSPQPSSAPVEQPNKFSDKPLNPKRVNKKCQQYSKFGQCKTPGCVYRHVDQPNPQKPQGENVEGGSKDFRREFSQTPDTAFMRGSRDTRQETSTPIDITSIPAQVHKHAPSQNSKMDSPFQESGSRSFPQPHTAEPSSSRSNFSKGVCHFYSRTGWCRHERACKYSHVLHPQKLQESKDNGFKQISTRPFENQFTTKPQNVVLQDVVNALNVDGSRDHLSIGSSNTPVHNSAVLNSTPPLAGNSNVRSPEAIKRYPEENSLEQLNGASSARPFKGESSQQSPRPQRLRKEPSHEKKGLVTKTHSGTATEDNNPSTETSSNNLPAKSGPSASKNKRKTKKKIDWWKSDPSEENTAPTWTYSAAAKPPAVQKAPMQIAKSSYSEVAKLPTQKSGSFQKNSGPTPVREKLFKVPDVLCKPGCKPIEALPYDPRVRTTDLGHGSWDTDYTLISWLENNLRREQRAEIFATYRNYLERGVIPLIALDSKRDLKPNVNLSSFSLLPNEIKEMIWRYALIHKRDVRVRLDTWEVKVGKIKETRNRIAAYNLSAPLLRTCQLSRQIVLAHYKIAFGTNAGGEARIHMDFKLDRLFIRHPDPNQLIHISEALHEKDLCRVRNLGVPMLHWIQGDNDMFFNAIAQFRKLRELSLVVGDSVKDHTFWKGRPICPFIERHLKAIWKERYPGVRSPGVFYQVIDATRAKHWGIDGIGFAGLVCGDTSVEARWRNMLKRD